ncbi:hypothetical protein PAMP_001900 [Pampus punctatissimus]
MTQPEGQTELLEDWLQKEPPAAICVRLAAAPASALRPPLASQALLLRELEADAQRPAAGWQMGYVTSHIQKELQGRRNPPEL